MTPLIGGLGAALGWAGATLFAAASSRRIGGMPTLAWVMLSGFLVTAPIVVVTGWPHGLDASAAGWLAIAGAGNVGGLALLYTGMRRAEVGVLASIVSTEGALAALIAIADGERPALLTAVGFVPLAIGVALVAAPPGMRRQVRVAGRDTAVALAVGAAVSFGLSLFAAGQASQSVPIGWVALPARLIGVVILVLALAASARPLTSPRLGRLAIGAGVCEVLGALMFAWAARDGIAVASVVSSQFAALAAVGAFVLFRERLVGRQVLGVAVLAAGVAMVALGSA